MPLQEPNTEEMSTAAALRQLLTAYRAGHLSDETFRGLLRAFGAIDQHGRPLSSLLNVPGRERAAALALIEGIGAAVSRAHQQGVVHGELRPECILVSASGEPKLVGFGASRTGVTSGDTQVRERTHMAPMTRLYASPEALGGMTPSARSDVYSLACIAWEVLTGAHPFGARTATAARDGGLVPTRTAPLSRREFQALKRALDFESARRTPTVQQFLAELRAPRRPRVIAAAALLSCAALAIGAYIALGPRIEADVTAPAPLPAQREVEAAPSLQAGVTFRDCPTCPLMKVLLPGRFVQGTSADAFESPAHEVAIDYRLAAGLYEVTVQEFAQFAAATSWQASGCRLYDGKWRNDAGASWKNAVPEQTERHPVSCVSWRDAAAYAAWLSQRTQQRYRLPSASEWEYAARAGSTAQQPWANGSAACDLANVADRTAASRYPGWTTYACADNYAQAAPVGTFAANGFGLHDMLGNVFEWVADCWQDDYRNAPADGSARLGDRCSERELRGGSWFTAPELVRTAYRNRFATDYRSASVGFRVVREVR